MSEGDKGVFGLTAFLSIGGRDGLQAGNASFHLLFAAAFVREAAVGVFELSVHFGGGTGEGILDVRGFVGDDEGLMTFGSGFEHAALVFWTGFSDVFAGQVNFDPGEVGVESLQEVVDIGPDGVGEPVVH